MKFLFLILTLVSTQGFAAVDPNLKNDDDSLIDYVQAIDSMAVSGMTISQAQLKEIQVEQRRALDQMSSMRLTYDSLMKKSSTEDAAVYQNEIAKLSKILKDHNL